MAGVHPPDPGSRQVLTRAGFTREALERSRLPDGGGGRTDIHTCALVRGDL